MPRKKTVPPEEPEETAGLPVQESPPEDGALPGAAETVPDAETAPGQELIPDPAAWNEGGDALDMVEVPPDGVGEENADRDGTHTESVAAPELPKSDRQLFYETDFHGLDRDLTPEERQEWNSIYASYRGRSALSGHIIGVDPMSVVTRDRETGRTVKRTMLCASVVPYRVRIVIPASEMWESGQERPDFVLKNMVGAQIDFIITKVDREGSFVIGSRRLAVRSQRYFFAHRPALCREGAWAKCRVLSVGPRRCLVECYGHDLNLTQRELRYSAIPDLRTVYHPGQELDCIIKGYDPEAGTLRISVKETESNPFDGAEQRHPVRSRRQAVIAGKYAGGVFCNLPDGTVCMCGYSYQHEDSDFSVGDTVILAVQRHDREKRQMYGKILTKW